MLHDYRYKKTGHTAPQFAGLVKEHLIRAAPQTNLAIDSKTIEIHGKFKTSTLSLKRETNKCI
jgi:hypothetical protein